MSKAKLILLGGFLGAGKTTFMMSLARHLSKRGYRVGVITNDQGDLLVDTSFMASAGFSAHEVLDGCFCCNFSSFVQNIAEILKGEHPDYVIAEPTGSCTDLVATVVTPLSLYHQGLLNIGAYLVLADAPRLAGEFRSMDLLNPITPREVLVSHQIRECRHIVLSKIDAATEEQNQEAIELLQRINREATIHPVSATSDEGMSALVDGIVGDTVNDIAGAVDIDYDLYAQAEGEMGWYNGRATLSASSPSHLFDPEDCAFRIAMSCKATVGSPLIHGKVLVTTETGSIKVSVVGGVIRGDITREGSDPVQKCEVTVNLRAVMPPQDLASLANEAIFSCGGETLSIEEHQFRALVPGAPVPKYRIID